MKAELRQKALKLRTKDRLSYGEIQKRLNVSKSTLSYWLREFPLSKQKIAELKEPINEATKSSGFPLNFFTIL